MSGGELTGSLRETLACLDGREPLTTTEAAERLGVGRRSAYDRLDRLVEAELVETKKVGASARVWWRGADDDRPGRGTGAGSRTGGRPEAVASRDDAPNDGVPNDGTPSDRVPNDDAPAAAPSGDGSDVPGDPGDTVRSVFERVSDAYFAVDGDWRVTFVNGTGERVLREAMGLGEGESVVGRRFADEVRRERVEPFFEHTTRAMREGEPVTFEERYGPLDAWYEVSAYPDREGLSVYFRDVTDRVRRERELERYEAIVESVEDAIYVVDDDDRFVTVNESLCEITGYGREELIGRDARDVVVDQGVVDEARRKVDALQAGDADADGELSIEVLRRDGSTVACETRLVPFPAGEDGGRCGVVRDVSGRIEREQRLERYETVVETVDDGIYAVDEESRFVMVNDSFCELSGYARDELLGVRTTDLEAGGVTEMAERLADDLRAGDGDADAATFEMDLLRSDGEQVPCETRIAPYEAADLVGRCGVVRDVSERIERERELRSQRERLAALNDLNEVVRDVTDAVIDRSTREEIERAVCERLAAAESYRLAWIGDVGPRDDRLVPRASAGADGYLDAVEVSTDPTEAQGCGPAGRAFRTGEPQIDRHVADDPVFESVSDAVAEFDVGSVAGIPIVHEGTIYGVLCVYSRRADGFDEEELDVVTQLGEVVGHAIAAVGRKRALLGDDVVELEFLVRDVFDTYDVEGSDEGRISFDHTVPVGGGEYVTYGTVTEELVGALDRLEGVADSWRSVTLREPDPDGVRRFELRQSEPPVLSIVASTGGALDRTVIENGDYRMCVHLSPSTDVRNVIDAVKESYPSAETVRRRDVSRAEREPDQTRRALTESLTERQRAVLEAAYHAGFFEWPRGTTGQEVAGSLGVAPSTFHQHLRKAERKVYDSLLGDGR